MPPVHVPTLTDGVVTLRAHREEDVAGVVEQSTDPVSIRWTRVPVPYGAEDARRFVREAMPGGWASDQEWGFALEVEGAYGGTVSLRNQGPGRAEIAYGAHPRARGRGFVLRGLRLLLDWGFSPAAEGGRDLESVVWWAERGNWASRRTAWRLGFPCDGTVRHWLEERDGLVDAWIGTLLRDDPREPRTPWLATPTLDLGPVRLRPLAERDDPRVTEACRDETQSYWIGAIPAPFGDDDARDWRETRIDAAASARAVTWAIADPDDVLLGVVSVFRLSQGAGEGELGYWLHPDARGRGIATTAARAAARHSLVAVDDGGLGLHRLRLTSAVGNEASRRVAEAVGFTFVGIEHRSVLTRAGLHDGALYELVPDR